VVRHPFPVREIAGSNPASVEATRPNAGRESIFSPLSLCQEIRFIITVRILFFIYRHWAPEFGRYYSGVCGKGPGDTCCYFI